MNLRKIKADQFYGTFTEELWNLHRGVWNHHRGISDHSQRNSGTFTEELWNLHRGTGQLGFNQTELLAAELHENQILRALHVLRVRSNESCGAARPTAGHQPRQKL